MPFADDRPRQTQEHLTSPSAVGARGKRALVFDSGLGGLTVLAGDRQGAAGPRCRLYRRRRRLSLWRARARRRSSSASARSSATLIARICARHRRHRLQHRLDPRACRRCAPPIPDVPFVGTVPAIKPAAEASRSGLISVLATPGTVARDYTRALVRDFAADCEVDARRLAAARRARRGALRGERVEDAEIAARNRALFRRTRRPADRPGRARLHAFSPAARLGSPRSRPGRSTSSIRRRRSRAGSMRCSGPRRRRAGRADARRRDLHQRPGAAASAAKGLAPLRAGRYALGGAHQGVALSDCGPRGRAAPIGRTPARERAMLGGECSPRD